MGWFSLAMCVQFAMACALAQVLIEKGFQIKTFLAMHECFTMTHEDYAAY
jgi:hypothetical protein